MKSSHTSISPLRRALVAATVVLATGSVAALAQTSDQGSTTTASSNATNDQNSNMSSNSANNGTNNDMNASNANASASDTNNNSSSSKLSWSDKRFLTKVAKANEDEIKLAQLGSQQASNPDVKNFAQQLVTDHQKLAQDLQTLASNKGVELKSEQKAEQGESHEYKKLAKASGTDFDRQFMDHMVSDHKKDVKEFKDRADDAKDPDVKSFAQNALPTLQHHLQMAQQLQQSVVPTGRSGKESWKYQGNATETGTTGTSATGATSNSTNSETSSGAATGSTTTTGSGTP